MNNIIYYQWRGGMLIPRHFCWTRFGTEAGESIGQILKRKEDERRANGGLFLWGIGNAVGPSMRELIRRESSPEVVFSPIHSKPRKEDLEPAQIVAWTAGRTLGGKLYDLPRGSLVTSRAISDKRKQKHYALVCGSAQPLQVRENAEAIPFSQLRNLLTDRRIGASQVTAIVRLADKHLDNTSLEYAVAIRAELVFPYFIELIDPIPMPHFLGSDTNAEQMKYADPGGYLQWLKERYAQRDFPCAKMQYGFSF